MTPRNPGRRKWFDHWTIRTATGLGLALMIVSLASLYLSIRNFRKPHSPHYEVNHCFDCHESKNSKMTSSDCFKCHDSLTRELLPNAIEDRKKISNQPCLHPIKMIDDNGARSITKLCMKCHSTAKAFVSLMNITTGRYVEIDISLTHPIGLMPTESIYPRTLSLSKETGAIDCVTCHDPHGTDKRFHLLRYYYPGNGRPADFRPLCNDCHPDGWLPLRLNTQTIVRDTKNNGQ